MQRPYAKEGVSYLAGRYSLELFVEKLIAKTLSDFVETRVPMCEGKPKVTSDRRYAFQKYRDFHSAISLDSGKNHTLKISFGLAAGVATSLGQRSFLTLKIVI